MRIDILTLFPGMFRGPFDESIIKRAIDAGLVDIHVHDIRNWAEGKHQVCDDYPYGGGPGMVLKPEPVFAATEAVLEMAPERGPIILMTPVGRRFDHDLAVRLAGEQRLVLLAGHYEGFDARVHEHLATHEISIGDYVLSGGELAAMVVVDAVVRHLPGALGSPESPQDESFAHGLLESPHYTRPPDFRGLGSARGAPLRPPRRSGEMAPPPEPAADREAPAGPDRLRGTVGRGPQVALGERVRYLTCA